MRTLLSILLLSILVGCGQMQSTDSSQSNQDSNEEKTTEEQSVEKKETETKNMSSTKNTSEDMQIYQDAFGDPVEEIVPATITIESIGVKADVEKVGLLDNGKMGNPKDYRNAAWYEKGPKPGEQGSAVISGHVNDPKGHGVFWDLEDLEVGEEVKVSDKNGKTLVFEVVDKKAFELGEAPVEQIFGYTPRRMLNLITCAGDYIDDLGTHNKRLVVYTELKMEK